MSFQSLHIFIAITINIFSINFTHIHRVTYPQLQKGKYYLIQDRINPLLQDKMTLLTETVGK